MLCLGALTIAPSVAVAACGSRTEIRAAASAGELVDSVAPPYFDLPRPARDGSSPYKPDAGEESGVTVQDAEAVPPIDAAFPSDSAAACAPGTELSAFLVSETGSFYHFDPNTLATELLGSLDCPSPGGAPFTMAVSRDGFALVEFSNGRIFRVDTTTLACTPTPYVDGQLGMPSNVGIATWNTASGERLLVYGCKFTATGCSPLLASADLTSFTLLPIGEVSPNPDEGYPPDIKTDAFGRLFACDAAGQLLQIDPSNAMLLGKDKTGLAAGSDLAVLTWNSQIFFFTQSQGTITRYDLATKQLVTLGSVGTPIVGAGAVPCLH